MNKEEFIEYFESNYSQLEDIIINSTVFCDYPNAECCHSIEEGLRILAGYGEKKAAALYCAIAAYGYCDNTFNEKTGRELLISTKASAEYYDLVLRVFSSTVDVEFYYYIYAFPVLGLMEEIREYHKNEDDSKTSSLIHT